MNKPVELFVVGRGNLYHAVKNVQVVEAVSNLAEGDWDIESPPDENLFNIAFHCGSGRQFPHLVDYCRRWKMVLIQASSSLKENGDINGKDIPIPTDLNFPYIDTMNLALPIAAVFRVVTLLGELMLKLEAQTDVLESHREGKKSAPSTTRKIAAPFNVPVGDIESIRRKRIQRHLLGIPEEHLESHAFHLAVSRACGAEIGLYTMVPTRDAYRQGLEVLIRRIVEMGDKLMPGIHQADEIIFG